MLSLHFVESDQASGHAAAAGEKPGRGSYLISGDSRWNGRGGHAGQRTYARIGNAVSSSGTAYRTFAEVAALSREGQLVQAMRGMLVELLPPDFPADQAPPSMENGPTQLWWSPFHNTFFTSQIKGQRKLTAVTRQQAEFAVRPVGGLGQGEPSELGEYCTTGILYFQGGGCTASEELRVADWALPKYRTAVMAAFGLRDDLPGAASGAAFGAAPGDDPYGASPGDEEGSYLAYLARLGKAAPEPTPPLDCRAAGLWLASSALDDGDSFVREGTPDLDLLSELEASSDFDI